MTVEYVIDGINPEPWTASEASTARKNGKDYIQFHKREQLRTYQNALKEEFRRLFPHVKPIEGEVCIEFYFWRDVASYRGGHANIADATNLQKATEDALQDVLFANDRAVRWVSSGVVAQAPGVDPAILIRVVDLPEAVAHAEGVLAAQRERHPSFFEPVHVGGPVEDYF